jgi:ATP-binding cassette subfamily C (CFTR/MRP) protein 1
VYGCKSDSKQTIALLFVSVHLALVILNSTKLKPKDSGARLSPSILAFIAALFAALLSRWEHTRSLRPSYVLQTYLLTSLLGRLVDIYADWENPSSDSIKTLEIVLCPLAAIFLAAESVRKDSILLEKKQHPPQALIGVFGQRLFLWLNRLFKRGSGMLDPVFTILADLSFKVTRRFSSSKPSVRLTNNYHRRMTVDTYGCSG